MRVPELCRVAIGLALCSPGVAATVELPFIVDGAFDEWAQVAPSHTDPVGDGNRIDFGRVWVESDAATLTLRLEVGAEINLQTNNAITIYLDTDGNPDTGCKKEGLGAELMWTFGHRTGLVCRKGAQAGVSYRDVGLLSAPTVSSTEFEVSFRRVRRDGSPLIPGPTASLVIRDRRGDDSGDRLPDGDSVVTLTLSDRDPPVPPKVSLERAAPNHLRILTWNVRFDGLFRRPAPFLRVLKALDPDVVCFQEIWSHTSRQAADQVALALPGSDWFGASAVEGHIVSRYPFLAESAIDPAGNYWALIDLPDHHYAADVSIVNGHPPCCDKEEERQDQLDGMAAWVRDLRERGGFEVPPGTPTFITGDMNLVGGANQLETILSGRIVNEDKYGASFHPDWDGTPLADADPRWTNGFSNATWIGHGESYSPGKLDYILYSDSNLRLENRFVLDTSLLTPEERARYGLRADDTKTASDHLPVVADFTLVAEPNGTAANE